MTTVLAVLIAVDPIGFGRVWPRRWVAGPVVALVLVVATLVARSTMDALDLSPEGFWIAAGIVLLVPALSRLASSTTRDVAGPAAVLVAMALATRDGRALTVVGAIIAGGAVVLATWRPLPGRWATVAERVLGALMVVVAFDLVRDGVLAV
jgi:small neutral amino acid transporter SnatA (MarC family)